MDYCGSGTGSTISVEKSGKNDEELRNRIVWLVRGLQNWNKHKLNDVLGIDSVIRVFREH
jgi:hypothetical protein